MNYETVGDKIHIGYRHPLYYSEVTYLSESSHNQSFRLLLIEEGSGIICFEDCSINFTAPTLLCLNEKDFPQFKNCEGVKIKSLYFYPHLINTLFNFENIRDNDNNFSDAEQQDCYLLLPFMYQDKHFKYQFSMEPNTFSKMSKLFEFIGRELLLQRDVFWPCRSRSYFLELLILVTRLFDSSQNTLENNLPSLPERVENVINYLHNNYQEKITLDQLATKFATNRTSLNNEFYEATNLSIIDYLIKLRVNLAATMLRNTKIPISEIMNRVGFNDNAHFWRTFKKHTSLSPKKYRDQNCWVEG